MCFMASGNVVRQRHLTKKKPQQQHKRPLHAGLITAILRTLSERIPPFHDGMLRLEEKEL
jgi:hypothetical protein